MRRAPFAFFAAMLFVAGEVIGASAPVDPAQGYPVRPVRVIIAAAPGGGSDILARLVGQKLSERLGQPVIVDARPGASGNIGHAIGAKAVPDGYTMMVGSSNFVANPALVRNNPYDALKDFAPITYAATSPNVLVVHPSFSPATFKEFMTLIKANPGKFNYASPATGTTSHLGAELLKIEGGLDITHVPYSGAGPAVLAVVGNQVPIAILGMPTAQPHIKSRALRALGITSTQRFPALPEVPTIAESGFPGFEADTPQMFLVPAGTPKAIVSRLNSEIVSILRLPEIRERLSVLGYETVASTPEETGRRIQSDIAKWKKVVTLANIKVE